MTALVRRARVSPQVLPWGLCGGAILIGASSAALAAAAVLAATLAVAVIAARAARAPAAGPHHPDTRDTRHTRRPPLLPPPLSLVPPPSSRGDRVSRVSSPRFSRRGAALH